MTSKRSIIINLMKKTCPARKKTNKMMTMPVGITKRKKKRSSRTQTRSLSTGTLTC